MTTSEKIEFAVPIVFCLICWGWALRERSKRKKAEDEIRLVDSFLALSDEEVQERFPD